MARFKPRPRRVVLDSDDFVVDNNRINIADADAFRRDPVNLIRLFRLAQKHNLAFHPDAMRAASRSLRLIDQKLRDDKTANGLFFEILTSEGAEVVLRRMNEAGVLGRFVRAFGRIVAMMQFNMYHHYTVDEHLLRCIGILADIEAGGNEEFVLASELMRTIQKPHRALLYVALFLHDIAKGRVEDHSIAGARIARRFCPRLGTVGGRDRHGRVAGRAAPGDVDHRAVARSLRPQDDREFRRRRAVARAHEAAADPHHRRHPRGRPRRVERLEGAALAHALLRDRAGAHRRLLGGEPAEARRDGAGRIPARAEGLEQGRARCLHRAPLPGLLAEGRPAAQGSRTRTSSNPRRPPARRSQPASVSTPRAASPN